ncbi:MULTISPECIES: hypothetical protein [Brucella]|uniref:hypothetical protein n=1 Tax=Brucella TaxID=234 RepID=UPI0001B591FC|nr:hypothetical protein C034_00839 [Brucella melitensis UK14/06]ENS76071.1 hypothetical protein C059_00837 [Brucella melitensis UK23/06]ENT17102.1 hypothetical protein B998_01211 [Brucella sp. F96/2]ENT23066.1 hypothetical protein C065_00856 [Brucella sp. UK1/97]
MLPGIFVVSRGKFEGGGRDDEPQMLCSAQYLCLIDWNGDFCHINGKSRLWYRRVAKPGEAGQFWSGCNGFDHRMPAGMKHRIDAIRKGLGLW